MSTDNQPYRNLQLTCLISVITMVKAYRYQCIFIGVGIFASVSYSGHCFEWLFKKIERQKLLHSFETSTYPPEHSEQTLSYHFALFTWYWGLCTHRNSTIRPRVSTKRLSASPSAPNIVTLYTRFLVCVCGMNENKRKSKDFFSSFFCKFFFCKVYRLDCCNFFWSLIKYLTNTCLILAREYKKGDADQAKVSQCPQRR